MDEEVLYKGRVWSVVEKGQVEFLRLSSGITVSTMVIGLDERGRILMIEKECLPVGGRALVLPGGKVEQGEEVKKATRREFEEETGYTVANLKLFGQLYIFPGYLDGKTICFVGDVGLRGERGGDDLDKVSPRWLVRGSLAKMVQEGKLRDARSAAFLGRYLL